ncbi:MAG: TlyA family RNA methyltransferase [Limnochordales bacterium]|nr:TlyA family RNA methyltransferase [Limnochordales bacterium]
MKTRLDVLLVEKGFFASRQQAQRAIMAGLVHVDGQRVDKPGTMVADTAAVEVRGKPFPYVSRGGLKLERALDVFGVDVQGLVAVDIGASTGGFTDCLLQRGARRVYAIDVGAGQLDWRLRQDPRVVVMERVNARHLRPADLPEAVDLAVIDVSFISLTKIFPAVRGLLKPEGRMIALVKPQFEAGRAHVGRRGVVRDPAVHRAVLRQVSAALGPNGFRPLDVTPSPIRGPEGNIEYLLLAQCVPVPAAPAGAPQDPPGDALEDTKAAAALDPAWAARLDRAVDEAHGAGDEQDGAGGL